MMIGRGVELLFGKLGAAGLLGRGLADRRVPCTFSAIDEGSEAMAAAGRDRKIDYIEFVVGDIARARAFYGAAFGWSFTEYGPDYLAFNDGRLDGGFTTEGKAKPGGALIILFADDLAAAQKKIEKAGGKIAKPIYSFPGGRRFHFTDPDGYELAVWSDK